MRDLPGRRWALAFLAWLACTFPALAECVGRNLVDVYAAENPAGIEAMWRSAHAIPNAEGRLWQVQRGDGPVSHLFGTFHAGSVVRDVPDAVWDHVARARIAVFEIDLDQRAAMQQRMASDPTFAFDLDAPPLAERLPEGSVPSVDAALRARGLSVRQATQMRPWLLVSLLGFPPCQLQAASAGEEALDVVLAKRARSEGVPLAGLETFEEAVAPLERMAPDLLYAEIASTAANADLAEDIFITHQALYASGQVQAIQEFSVWLGEYLNPGEDLRAGSEAFLDALLVGRNKAWMPKLLAHLDGGNAFIAVGALHLPGETGLIELLRARGYSVTRLD